MYNMYIPLLMYLTLTKPAVTSEPTIPVKGDRAHYAVRLHLLAWVKGSPSMMLTLCGLKILWFVKRKRSNSLKDPQN